MRRNHQQLSRILHTEVKQRTREEWDELQTLIRTAMKALVAAADMIFTTTTLSGSKMIRPFVADVDIVCVDEAACATELEILIPWKADKPLILAADPEQIRPPVFSDGTKDEGGSLVNGFVKQLEQSFFRRLIDSNRPYIDLNEQRRMPPGQFGPANFAVYGNVTMAANVNIDEDRFALARAPEVWTKTLNKYGVYVMDPELQKLKLPASLPGTITPILVAIARSFCYTVPGSTSKANTAIAHYVLLYIRMIKAATGATNKMIVILVPYLQQRRLCIQTILAAEEEFGGITVATTNSFLGREREFVFADFCGAANLGGKVGFIADKHRLSTKITRQTKFLVAFGNPACTKVRVEAPVEGQEQMTQEELQLEADKKYNLNTLKRFFQISRIRAQFCTRMPAIWNSHSWSSGILLMRLRPRCQRLQL
jgi:superfamily I DNA and/or RNA helicase